MGRGAKNHRFRPGSEIGPSAGRETDPRAPGERRGKRDRRDPRGADRHGGVERRRGPRRATDLGVPVWRNPLALVVAVGLGVGASLALGSQAPAPSGVQDAELAPAPPVDPDALAGVQALRDEAQALTPAQVELDEATHERWMPRVARIEQALDDPATPEAIRAELQATIAALECVGVLTSSGTPTCVTIGPQ
ncbi:hypothetical protein ENSA5_38310 [Enhygromyxa salina]|uniref:Uncharacterized protein n=1 Tax=Enhygromyxa salina TaxID=215803 RepID=A0A2S9XRW2_9BACT|nr:hypothetical protein [Enhygromyxa salina]PRP95480.1 hypothetical protein ENSA5_38310 [Enhygromyxa salina]